MHFDKKDIEIYLQGVWAAIDDGKYQIAPRPKNRKLLTDYVISEEKELDIIKLYFKENLTLKEIGEKYNLTKQRISKILNNALYKLKDDYEKLEKNINKSR